MVHSRFSPLVVLGRGVLVKVVLAGLLRYTIAILGLCSKIAKLRFFDTGLWP